MNTHLAFCASLALASLSMLGCETRVDADSRGDAGTVIVRDRDRVVDADINVTGPRGNSIRVDLDEGRRPNDPDNSLDIRVDADRPLLRRDNDDRRVRETRRGVRVDVKD